MLRNQYPEGTILALRPKCNLHVIKSLYECTKTTIKLQLKLNCYDIKIKNKQPQKMSEFYFNNIQSIYT